MRDRAPGGDRALAGRSAPSRPASGTGSRRSAAARAGCRSWAPTAGRLEAAVDAILARPELASRPTRRARDELRDLIESAW